MTPTDEARRTRVLRQFLLTQRLLGVETVPMRRATTPDEAVGQHVEMPAEIQGVFGQPVVERAVERAPSPVRVKLEVLSTPEKAQRLREMDEQEVRNCTQCGLCEGRTRTVFGVGDVDAWLMFVGEGPGAEEDRQGEPFVGKAGELLNKQIAAMGLTRESVYIANVVKCRPPENRKPTAQESQACEGYLARQIALVRPRVIVALGAVAATSLLGTTRGITALRGQWGVYRGLSHLGLEVPVMPTFHPAFLLRAYTVENRKAVWSDLQQVMRFPD